MANMVTMKAPWGAEVKVPANQVSGKQAAGWTVVSYWQPDPVPTSGVAAGDSIMAGGNQAPQYDTGAAGQQGAIGSAFGGQADSGSSWDAFSWLAQVLSGGTWNNYAADTTAPPSQTVGGQLYSMASGYARPRPDGLVSQEELEIDPNRRYGTFASDRFVITQGEDRQMQFELTEPVYYTDEFGNQYLLGQQAKGMEDNAAVEYIMDYAQISEKDAWEYWDWIKSLQPADAGEYGLGGSGGGRGGSGGGGRVGPTYVAPDRRAIEETVRNQMVALIGSIESQNVGKIVDAYMRDHRKAWEGASLDPNMTILEELRSLDSYKKIHKLRPDSANEATWVSQHRSAWQQGGGRVGEAEEKAQQLATIGATASADNATLSEFGAGFETNTFKSRMTNAAKVAASKVR